MKINPHYRYHTTLIFFGLVGLNTALVLPLFYGGYTKYMGSIESAFLTDARFISENFPYVSWNREWYMGFPFHLFYNPALPYVVAGVHKVSGISITSAYRILIGIFYVLIPGTMFLFVYYLTDRRYPAAVAALIYSLAPSFCYLIPEVRNDAAHFGYSPWHLRVLLRYGEGPHISALAFTPLAALGLMRAMRHPSLRNIVLAALAISAVAMTNWVALFALTVILLVVVLSEILVGDCWRKFKTALACIVLTYGLCAFWFNYSFIEAALADIGGSRRWIVAFVGNWPAVVFLGFVAGITMIRFFRGKAKLQPGFIVGASLLAFSTLVFAWYGMHVDLAPQGGRYMPELNMFAAAAFGMLADRGRAILWDRNTKLTRLLSRAIAPAILVFLVLASMPFLQVAHAATSPSPDITATSEYQVSQWLATHVSGERVYATGSHCFWLNVFTSVPQIRGGTDQGVAAMSWSWWKHVAYQINTGKNGKIAVAWARALGIKYIVVSFPGSADVYQDYVYPEKFEGLLSQVYTERGMAIFEVPLKRPGLVHVVDLSAYNRLLRIRDAVDMDRLNSYVELVERSLPVDGHRFVNNGRLEFETSLHGPYQAVLVRMTYHPSWRAYCNGQHVPIRKDLAGFILIEPHCQGHCHFALEHGPLWDQWLGYTLTVLAIAGLVLRALFLRKQTQPSTFNSHRSNLMVNKDSSWKDQLKRIRDPLKARSSVTRIIALCANGQRNPTSYAVDVGALT